MAAPGSIAKVGRDYRTFRLVLKRATILYLLLLITTAQAQQPPYGNWKFVPTPRGEIGDYAEPLELKHIEPSHFWIYVKWPDQLPEKDRIINGKAVAPAAPTGVESKMIQPEYIEPQFSKDIATSNRFRELYAKGLKEFLGGKATFRVTLTSRPFSGPGQQRCVFSFGEKPEDTLQYKMVRSGYAVVRGSDPTPITETLTGGGQSFELTIHPKPDAPAKVNAFGKAFLNRLLTAQKEARLEQIGVWSGMDAQSGTR